MPPEWPTTCTSTWRPCSTYGSTKTVPSPNADAASAAAFAVSAGRSASARTTRIPRPPPPAEALTSSGRSASVASSAVRLPSTGTPAAAISSLAAILEPIDSIDSGAGPTQTRPASITARAKSAFSERKP
jgi:hypothetical protein